MVQLLTRCLKCRTMDEVRLNMLEALDGEERVVAQTPDTGAEAAEHVPEEGVSSVDGVAFTVALKD